MIRLRFKVCAFALLSLMLFAVLPAWAKTDWQVYQTLQLEETPIDMLADAKSRRMYILTDKGWLLIYTMDGRLRDRIEVGADVEQIKPGPKEGILYLLSSKAKTVRLVSINLIEEINIKGAPSKGPSDAAVAVVVFSDFQ